MLCKHTDAMAMLLAGCLVVPVGLVHHQSQASQPLLDNAQKRLLLCHHRMCGEVSAAMYSTQHIVTDRVACNITHVTLSM